MDPIIVKQKLISVLIAIQGLLERDGAEIDGNTRPLVDLFGFDSKVWPVATTMLAALLGIEISNRRNIFRAPGSKRALTIDEIVRTICSLDVSAQNASNQRRRLPTRPARSHRTS